MYSTRRVFFLLSVSVVYNCYGKVTNYYKWILQKSRLNQLIKATQRRKHTKQQKIGNEMQWLASVVPSSTRLVRWISNRRDVRTNIDTRVDEDCVVEPWDAESEFLHQSSYVLKLWVTCGKCHVVVVTRNHLRENPKK